MRGRYSAVMHRRRLCGPTRVWHKGLWVLLQLAPGIPGQQHARSQSPAVRLSALFMTWQLLMHPGSDVTCVKDSPCVHADRGKLECKPFSGPMRL
jgi:hypothetical protein